MAKSCLVLLLAGGALAGLAGVGWLVSGLARCQSLIMHLKGWLTASFGSKF